MNGLHFFFMKVGAGNRFMGFNDQLGDLEDRQGLWVGYYGREIPAITKAGKFQGPLDDAELCTMALASRTSFRKRAIACVFTETHLTIWKITGPLGQLSKDQVDRFAKIPYGDLKGILKSDREWKQAEETAGKGRVNVPAFFRGFHWLPASLICQIPRHKLLAPVDSLRVHRWLNSGTFRPLHTMTGNGLMGDLPWLDEISDLTDTVGGKPETPYAKLVRTYLEILIDQWGEPNDVLKPIHPPLSITDEEIETLASRWVNPAQLETVAALMALDLGFTLEVGMGKGQDIVDVKASLGHLSMAKRKAAVKSCVQRLSVLSVTLTDLFQDRLANDGVLWIQCKAQDLEDKPAKGLKNEDPASDSSMRGKAPNPDLVLTFLPGGSSDSTPHRGRLHLWTLMEAVLAPGTKNTFPHLRDWLTLYLKQVRQALCETKS